MVNKVADDVNKRENLKNMESVTEHALPTVTQ